MKFHPNVWRVYLLRSVPMPWYAAQFYGQRRYFWTFHGATRWLATCRAEKSRQAARLPGT